MVLGLKHSYAELSWQRLVMHLLCSHAFGMQRQSTPHSIPFTVTCQETSVRFIYSFLPCNSLSVARQIGSFITCFSCIKG